MNIPNKRERLMLMSDVEKNCKTKGRYMKPEVIQYSKFIEKVKRNFSIYGKSIDNCLTSVKNIISELAQWVHVGSDTLNSLKLDWFKSFLQTVLKCARHGLFFAVSIMRKIGKTMFKNYVNTAMSTIAVGSVVTAINGIVCGVVASVVIVGIALWLEQAELKLNKINTLSIRLKNKIYSFLKGLFSKDAEIPDEIKPPIPEVPTFAVSFLHECELVESVEMLAGVLFAIFLKAAIAHKFNEEICEKTEILKSLISPSSTLLGFLSVLVFIGSGGVSSAI